MFTIDAIWGGLQLACLVRVEKKVLFSTAKAVLNRREIAPFGVISFPLRSNGICTLDFNKAS